MRITLDTAILVRTNTKAMGPAKELLDAIQQCGAVLVLSPFLIREAEGPPVVLKDPDDVIRARVADWVSTASCVRIQ